MMRQSMGQVSRAAIMISMVVGAHDTAAADALVKIDLPALVQTEQPEVRLGDVASLASKDLSTLQRLMALPLGRVPQSGEMVELERVALATWIRNRTGIDPERISWRGAERMAVSLQVQQIPGAQLVDAATEVLQKWLATRSTRAEVVASRMPQDVTASGAAKLSVRPLPDSGLVPRQMTVWVEVWSQTRFVRAIPVSFSIHAYADGLIASSTATRGSDVSSVVWQPVEVEITGRHAAVRLPAPTSSTGDDFMRMRRTVSAGQPLSRDDVEALPQVTQGGWATLHTRAGEVELESRVEILQDGAKGQWVRVRMQNATSSFLARVTGRGTVEISQ